jgi:molecular chaperone GrpE
MTDTKAGVPETDPRNEPNQDDPPAVTDAASTAPDDPASSTAVEPVEALTREVADLKDRLLRALAEMENLRRRTERQVADERVYGISNFARDMLSVADNMRRALDAVGPELRESADPAARAFVEGVELTERELLKVLEKRGVKKLEPQGQKFDPNLHQAMYEVPDASVPPGTVVQVVQSGYTIGDRVLRPALVAIAKKMSDVGGQRSDVG